MQAVTVALMVLVYVVLVFPHFWRLRKLECEVLGLQLVLEAQRIAVGYPAEYPVYRREVVYELNRLKMSELIESLP